MQESILKIGRQYTSHPVYDMLRHGKPLQIKMLLNYTEARPCTKRSHGRFAQKRLLKSCSVRNSQCDSWQSTLSTLFVHIV
jgi:hypothetical protein